MSEVESEHDEEKAVGVKAFKVGPKHKPIFMFCHVGTVRSLIPWYPNGLCHSFLVATENCLSVNSKD